MTEHSPFWSGEAKSEGGRRSVRVLDLFCGRFGWSRAFAARGWECVGVDLVEPAEFPDDAGLCGKTFWNGVGRMFAVLRAGDSISYAQVRPASSSRFTA